MMKRRLRETKERYTRLSFDFLLTYPNNVSSPPTYYIVGKEPNCIISKLQELMLHQIDMKD